ncbi:MAG TPA: cysteine desulfurase [Candidatus Limnocylindrales bacterium]|nr:cysteine desulfurase [Candidatus Limnocylindrales bacterium]
MTVAARASAGPGGLDVANIRRQFPILSEKISGHPLVYLDNAASTQKPRAVLDAVAHYYEHDNANVHRGVHTLSERATVCYEGARSKIAQFVGAADSSEIIFVRGATEALNLVAMSYGGDVLGEGDQVVLTEMEHHSNIVPWQMICARTGAQLRVVPILENGELDMKAYAETVGARTKIVAASHVSNALGTVNPIAEMARIAHAAGATIVVDGAQAAGHRPVDVAALGCDFYAFSGHKMYAPMGIGGLWGRRELLDAMSPWQGGGEMILTVTFEKTTYNVAPHKFEAGTPDVGGAVGLAAAVEWIESLGREVLADAEHALLAYAETALLSVPGLRIVGTAREKSAVHSFVLEGVHPHDIGTILDSEGIAIRTGHHCAQPVMDHFGIAGTARASFAAYNTADDVDRLVEGLAKVQEMFA